MNPSLQLKNVDLNLLLPLKALLEERNVTRAANRIHLSQPAMSRVLERLRETLRDELLIRSQGGYILTARGTKLLQEIDQVIPRLEALWTGETFSPRLTTDKVRMVMTDMAAAIILPCITRALPQHAPGLRIEVVPWTEGAYDQLASGAVDLVFSPIAAPPPLKVQLLYNEEFVCLLANAHPYKGKTLTIKKYLELKHVVIETEPGQQTLVDRALTEGGYRRNIWLQLPYFIAAIAALQDTDYVLTCPSRLAKQMFSRYALHSIKAPPEIPAFSYFMFWHPRLTDENLHSWFREFVLDSCARELGDPKR